MKIINVIKNKSSIFITLGLLFVFSFMTVGYAVYQKSTNIIGGITLKPDGDLQITSITLTDSKNVLSSEDPIFMDQTISFDLSFGGSESEFYALYAIVVENNSSYDYTYHSFNFNPVVTSSGGGDGTLALEVTGITEDEIVSASSTRTIYIKLVFTPSDANQTYGVTITTDIDIESQESGSFLIEILNDNIDLTNGKSKQPLTLRIYNTYSKSITFTPSVTNSAFKLTNSSGNSLNGMTIGANDTQDYIIYLSKKNNDPFFSSPVTSNILLNCTNLGKFYTNSFNILVDVSELPDTEKPVIDSITISKNTAEGIIDVAWKASDNSLGDIDYVISLYNASNNNQVGNSINVTSSSSSEQTSQFTGISQGANIVNYYAKIVATDKSGNSSNSTSSTIKVRWLVNVSFLLGTDTSANPSSSTTEYGSSYMTTLSYSGSSLLGSVDSSSVTVTMKDENGNSETIINKGSSTDTNKYTYSSNKITINNVTGDIKISASSNSGCLVKGTMVKLANGSEKAIEDITYNDLLLTWDYEHGRFAYEYPIWIEKVGSTNIYQINTFSDGTVLKTMGYHGVYSNDFNEIVSVDNPSKFYIGSNISKYDETTNSFINVYVTNIEIVREEANYYHVVSTRYYNIIANSILTTDGTTILTNLYGFNDNMTWLINRKSIISDNNNIYNYFDLSDIMPYYLFVGLRAYEGKYLNNRGYMTADMFRYYLLKNQLNDNMWLQPEKDSLGNRKWLVTTSDNLNESISVSEGTEYIVPESNKKDNFDYWYNHADGNNYSPGDKLIIWTGTYLEAIYK